MQYTDQDVKDLSYCGWMEARGDGISGCCLVMQVIVNRANAPKDAYFPKTIHGVIYLPNAFSWTRPDDPEHNTQPATNDVMYQACLLDAPEILKGTDDLTKGALYYANEATTGSGWYRTNIIEKPDLHPITLVYKHHTFRK